MERKKMPISKQIAERKETVEKKVNVFAPTGSTLLNLACSDRPNGGFHAGKMVNIVGDSSSGKTMLTYQCLAECARLKQFEEYRFIKDDAEAADEFDLEGLFGSKMYERLEAPRVDENGDPIYSDTVEDFSDNVHNALDDGRPFIYVLDSLDSLSAKAEQEKVKKLKEAREKGTKEAGTYAMDVPKQMSLLLRSIIGRLHKTKSILIIISQTRDNIDPMSPEKKTRSGGKALKFYATHEIWLSNKCKLSKTKNNISFEIGNDVIAKVTKNKITGKRRKVEFPIYYDYGLDDIASCIDFMVTAQYWKKSGTKIKIEELGLEGQKANLIKEIEDNDLHLKVSSLVGKAWKEMEDAVKLNRKSRYD